MPTLTGMKNKIEAMRDELAPVDPYFVTIEKSYENRGLPVVAIELVIGNQKVVLRRNRDNGETLKDMLDLVKETCYRVGDDRPVYPIMIVRGR